MNGRTPPTPAPPPSVQRARRQYGPRRGWTGLWKSRIVLALVALAVVAVVGAQVAIQWGKKAVTSKVAESTMEPVWGRQKYEYKAEAPVLPETPAPPVDTISPELARLRAEMVKLAAELENLKNRKTTSTTTVVNNGGRQATIPRATAPPLLFASHDLSKEVVAAKPKVPEYVLAPWATRLPCVIEPLMNSDVPGAFTAKVNQNVYDTKTHRHLLVPQGATVGGVDRGETIVYGNERLPTVALALTIEDRTYDLGNAPVTDQLGTNGLTGDVDQHYGRLLAAVLIQGVLKAGTVAITEAAGGTAVSGFTSTGDQATNKVTAPMLQTRPTIRVFPGQGCTILLTKPLTLPAMWE